MSGYVLAADWTWTGEGFARHLHAAIGDDGRIVQVGELGLTPDLLLRGNALLPGMVSAHSHAFQRGLRGRGERFPAGSGSFWTWRQAMYGLVERLDPEELHRLSLQTFREMRAAGITSVGEFHYLHHSPDRADYAY
ncbi:MAG: amidohydrolase family protein, partial [Acidobacteriota bacterium]|nr:amidohydrolase family protein [Acidobacteriota bacterium]